MSDESITERHSAIGTADWYRALPLVERLAHRPYPRNAAVEGAPGEDALRESAGAVRGSPDPAPVDFPPSVRQLLARWKSQPPFATTSLFSDRLAADGITENDLLSLLAESPESLRQRTPVPEWLAKIEQAYSEVSKGEPISWPEDFRSPQASGFLACIQPLIDRALIELKNRIRLLAQDKARVPFDLAAIHDLFIPHLPQRLLGRLSRTLVLELNVARVQGKLAGETAEERFANFVARLRSPGNMLAIFREYPVLARELVQCLDYWIAVSVEFLDRLATDWSAIRQAFCRDDDPGPLIEVKADAGDRHRQGRSVFLLKFRSGLRLVYKPKLLAVDVHFQELLDWIRKYDEPADLRGLTSPAQDLATSPPHHLAVPLLRIPRVMDRGVYGWVEFVEARTCQSRQELELFYRRQGAYLALFYALGAIDFHHENLIAHGEHPIPIDLEALFHPRGLEGETKRADYLANIMLYNSVFGIGLLPGRIWSSPQSEGVDISGLGAMPGQLMPFASPAWEAEGTDQMRLIRKRYSMPEAQNRPTLNGQAVETVGYTEELIAGFRDMYGLLVARREELLSAKGPLAWFGEDEVRVVIRPTRSYADLLRESFHPDVLRDGLDRDRLFDRLWNGAEESPFLSKLIPAERTDLWNGDVPMFTTRPTSCDIWTSSGQRIALVLDESGMERARHRIVAMGAEDLSKQLWFIRASLATLSPPRRRPAAPTYVLAEAPVKAERGQFLAAARAVGDRLENLAVRGEGDVSWIGLALLQERFWSLVPLGPDFYDGLPGLAFFFGYLGKIAVEKRYTQLSQGAVTTLRNSLRRYPQGVTSIGAFAGWGGLIYTWTHLGDLWRDVDLLTEAEGFAGRLLDLIDKDEGLDIIDGAAGCLLALLGLESRLGSKSALAAATRLGDRLLATAQVVDGGLGWTTRVPATAPLAGMSHGAAGIAWALCSLGARTGDQRYLETARAAIAYERNLYSVENKNWPDLRNFPSESGGDRRFEYMTAWCHGAAGIGLARLGCLRYLNDPLAQEEIETALYKTRADGFGFNHSLCHGDLGNVELLAKAGEVLADPYWQSEAERVASNVLSSIQRHGWLCANPVGIESPGLMTGLAGVGYGLLRLADPDRVPCILTLEGPRALSS
jgi:type 2 lantibiotic biosynthesis protein LanM